LGQGLVLFVAAVAHPLHTGAQEASPPQQGASAPGPAQEPAQDPQAQDPQAQSPQAQPQEDKVTVRGSVFDGLNKINMIGATVKVTAQGVETTTDDNGEYTFELPAGRHEIEISFESYKTLRVPIVIPPAAPGAGPQEVTVPRATLQVEAVLLKKTETYVIREPKRDSQEAQNLVRKNSARVSDVVSAQEIQKSADASASQAAARVVGASVVGDRFVYVRGLGERYANSLFNGAPLPSPEPDQQAVPFDIFPASLLANLTIAKSATADIPADFAGGSVQINTKEFPSKLTVGLSLGLGANLSAAFQPFLTYPGGRADFLGIDDGTRAAPPVPAQLRAPDGSLLPRRDVAAIARQFRNTWTPREVRGPIDYSVSASVGNQATFGSRKLGYLFALTYSADHQSRAPRINVFNLDSGQLQNQVSLTGPVSIRGVQWGGLGSLVFVPRIGHVLSLSGIFTQNSDDEARVLEGFSRENLTDVWSSRLRFVSRTLGFVQLGGAHRVERDLSTGKGRLGTTEVEWRATYANAGRDEPDNREAFYLKQGSGAYSFFNSGNSGQRFYSRNGEHQASGGLDVTQAFRQWAKLEGRFKAGAMVRYRVRDFSARRYQFFSYGKDAAGQPINTLPPEQLFAPENISEQNGVGVELRDNTLPSDAYSGRMGVYAAYAMLDTPLHQRVRLVAGLRFEGSQQLIDSKDINGNPINISRGYYDALPSANLVYRAREDMNLRAGFSMTVARPEFRELVPFQFVDYFGGELVRGNPDLTRTRIYNADLRWEWFAGPVDLLAVSAFYKHFEQPIETTISPGGNLIRSFANAPGADTVGIEVEGRKDLGFLREAVRGLAVGGNASYMYSRVDLTGVSETLTSKVRPLQGQSPFVINAFVEYERDFSRVGLSGRVLYNVFGARVDQVGALGLPDRYQQPRHMLDATLTLRFLRSGLSLRLSAKNLIDSPVLVTQQNPATGEDQTALEYRTGRLISLSLGYNR
jgi:hypothetical protein